MNELTPSDIRVAGDYEAARDAQRRHLAAVKRHRRVVIADTVALVFENRETLCGVVEEVVRTEHLRDQEQIAAEVAAFNTILPGPGELSACLYLEVADAGDLADCARRLAGVERAVFIEIAGDRVTGSAGQVDVEAGAPAMHHIRFTLSDSQRRAWLDRARIVVGCEHPQCSGRVELDEQQRDALAADLAES